MNLGAFSVVVGAPAKWVVNALQVLGRQRDYSFSTARILRLVRVLNARLGVSIKRGWVMAAGVLEQPSEKSAWFLEDPGSGVTLGVDRERFLSSLACALGASRVLYRPGRRGRPGTPAPLDERLRGTTTDRTALVRSLGMTVAVHAQRSQVPGNLGSEGGRG